MSPSVTDKGDQGTVVSDGAGHSAGRTAASTAVATRSARAPGAHRGIDYRLRGLVIDPTIPVSAPPSRTEPLPQHRSRHIPLLAEVAILIAVTVLAVWLLQAFVVRPYSVGGAAMAPTIQAGDRILIVKAGPLVGSIHSGEVVVLRPPKSLSCTIAGGHSGDLVLRIVALPGQTIWSVRNTIFVDGRPLAERGWYDTRYGQVGSTPIPSTRLGPSQYFAMGDNRAQACDSRVFGPISKSSVVGEGIAIVERRGHVFIRTL